MASHATHIRRIYDRPRQRGTATDPGKVTTCIQVGVRPETTGTLKTMPNALTQCAAPGTRLAGVGWMDVVHGDAGRARLVLDEGLQLSKGPAVQTSADALTAHDALTDVGQILHCNAGGTNPHGLPHDGLARFVVSVPDASLFAAGDLSELLPGALTVVGLKTTTQGKVLVAPMAQSLTAPDLARAGGGESDFPDIQAHHRAGCNRYGVLGLDREVQVPNPLAADEFGFLWRTPSQDPALMLTEEQRNRDAAGERVERNGVAPKGVGAPIEVDARAVEAQQGHWRVLADSAQLFLRSVRLAYREDGAAAHLRPERCLGPQQRVGQVVEGDAVPAAVRLHDGDHAVTRLGVSRLQRGQRRRLFRCDVKLDRGGAEHRAEPLVLVLHTLDHVARSRLHALLLRFANKGALCARRFFAIAITGFLTRYL